MPRQTLEISLIVKNGAPTLARALASVAPVASRILVGDTGSCDNSREIARQCGAEVVDIPWENDFSRARNLLLDQARCDWIFSIDADEMLGPEGPELLRNLLTENAPAAYDVLRWNYVRKPTMRGGDEPPIPNPGLLPEARHFPAYVLTTNTRLFRRDWRIRFDFPVHETVVHRLDALGLPHPPANFVLHHLGQAEDSKELRREKYELYHELGLKKANATPHLAEGWFELGLSELELHRNPAVALPLFERAHSIDPALPRHSLFCGICLTALGRLPEAHARIAEAHRLGSRSPVLFEALGDVYFHAEQYQQARAAYGQGGPSPLNQAKLGACDVMLGQSAQGLERIRNSIARCPDFTELHNILIASEAVATEMQRLAQPAAPSQ